MTASRAARWTRRLCRAVRDDVRDFHAAVSNRPARPGLHVYDFDLPHGRRRFHLRVGAAGDSVLLVDVCDAIHLNRTATLLVQMALRGESELRAAAALRQRFPHVTLEEAARQAETAYAMIEAIKSTAGQCAACSLVAVDKEPYFSLPISAPFKADLALSVRLQQRVFALL